MKADPPLPSVSAREVIAKGKVPTLTGTAPITIPIFTKTNPDGTTELIHSETGESLGLCASEEIAENTKRFFR